MSIKSNTFVLENETEWEHAGNGMRRQILGYDNSLMIVKVEFEKDAVGSEHSHPHSQSTYVASGVFEFAVGDEKQVVKPGDGIYIEPNVKHGVTCIEAGILIDAFSPMRDDFLKA
ncbi:cupin domain-containing protein [Paludibacter sp. 221]|uniref:cupin domain-containing protein n=1 Tax=Paludibacter sp. 221 TaxID=2302939 RepID=UPI0013D5EB1A|nr:cupin domain-containing protein [Paludibacter sp. 221]NDV45846.1 cupin domain-containing protein [Paludibacter sp. 221]